MTGYNPRRPLLGASIKGASAQIFVSMLRRQDVERRSAGLPAAVRSKLLDDWDEIAAAAAEYRRRCQENEEGASRPPTAPDHPHAPVADPSTGHPERLPAADVAAILGVVPRRVGQLIASGRLDGVKVGNMWMINMESVRDYQAAELIARKAS